MVKNPPAMLDGQENSLEKGMDTHSVILAWGILPPQLESSPCLPQPEKSLPSSEDPAQPKINK